MSGPLTAVPPEPIDERTALIQSGQTDHDAEGGTNGPDQGHDESADRSTRESLMVIGPLWTVLFFAALDATVVATISGPISSSLNSGTWFSWIASGYMIANAACQPLSGKLTDIYGRPAGLIWAVAFFSVGTLFCGLAPNGAAMIAARVLAGMGGGCVNTVGVFVISDLIPLRSRGLWQGFNNLIFGAGMALGGLYGGFVTDTLGWRYAFIMQVPFIVIAGIWAITRLMSLPIKDSGAGKIKRVDFLGAFTLVAALVSLLTGLNSGGNIVPWHHPLVYMTIPLSVVLLLLFIYIEDHVASEPILPVRLLGKASVAAANLTLWFMSMSMFTLYFYIPVFLNVICGVSTTTTGIALVPFAIMTSCGSLGAGYWMRRTGKYKGMIYIIQIINVAASVLLVLLMDRNTSFTIPTTVIGSLGGVQGAMLTITLIALISAVDHEYHSVVASASYAFRSTGASLGLTIASAVFQNLLRTALRDRFGDQPGANDIIKRIRDDISIVPHLPDTWRDGVIDAYVVAFRGVWVTALTLAVLAALSTLFIKQHTLHSNLARK